MAAKFLFNEVILQPTSLCNLNCSYCYLPLKNKNNLMSPEIPARIAHSLSKLPPTLKPVRILWHCGEPLACGLNHFKALIAPFEKLEAAGRIRHAIQTNGTLIDRKWCEFFKEHNFDVGVSLDGPAWANHHRVNWVGGASFPKIIRGIEYLKEAGIPLNICAVVVQEMLDHAREFYQFFVELGCQGLSINIEERLGANTERELIDDARRVQKFWSEFIEAWRAHPSISIREINYLLDWGSEYGQAAPVTLGVIEAGAASQTNLYPTVNWKGDISFLSPELMDTPTSHYQTFVVGNVVQEPFFNIVQRAKTANYVLDFLNGKEDCKNTCKYYSFCGGGYASSKFFELATTAGTETACCRNSRQRLFDAFYPGYREQLSVPESQVNQPSLTI